MLTNNMFFYGIFVIKILNKPTVNSNWDDQMNYLNVVVRCFRFFFLFNARPKIKATCSGFIYIYKYFIYISVIYNNTPFN